MTQQDDGLDDLFETPDAEVNDDDQEEGDLVDVSKSTVRIEKNDRALAQLYGWYKDGRLDIDPEWQREFVWDKRRSSKLIESVLRDIPIPVIYLGQTDAGDYEVIDGLQRLKSIFLFFDNSYPLTGLELMPEHNRQTFADLSRKEQNKLRDATLRTYELSSDTPKDLMFIIFERLNTGGVKLNEQEIRNCLFRGPLNDLINRLAKDEAFIACLNQDNLSKRMKDRTFVLRFLAFFERTHAKVTKGLKAFLNDFLGTYQSPTESKLKEFETVFRKAMKVSRTVFGDTGFRIWSENGWSKTPNLAIFQCVATSFCGHDQGQLTRAADSIYEAYVDLVSTDLKFRHCVTQATADSKRIAYAFTAWRDRLGKALEVAEPNDSRRCFSRELKQSMFATRNVCALCKQKISLIDDAALDHSLEYWRGGLTVPSNAQLTHRRCNSEKGRGSRR